MSASKSKTNTGKGTSKTVLDKIFAPTPITESICRSIFNITFAVEILNSNVHKDLKEGWAELEQSLQSVRLQYQLYYGQNFDVDIALFPVAAKVTFNSETCWVRSFQFLSTRWVTFTISHAIGVRVRDLRRYEAYVNVSWSSGGGGRGSAPETIYLPPLEFGVRRYFGKAFESVPNFTIKQFIKDWIWSLIEKYIPTTVFDSVKIDAPYSVSDVRHQDEILSKVREFVLKRSIEMQESHHKSVPFLGRRSSNKLGVGSKDKKKDKELKKYEIKLSGDSILAGAGRVIPFEISGWPAPDAGQVIPILSTMNLPAPDDCPVVFVNINKLFNAPLEEFQNLRITHLYTRWHLGDEVRHSRHIEISNKSSDQELDFNDHHAISFEPSRMTETTATFLDDYYSIELRGIRTPISEITPLPAKLFGQDANDRHYSKFSPKLTEPDETDFLIAVTKINAQPLGRGINSFIKEEYALFPPRQYVKPEDGPGSCTNEINLIGVPVKPEYVVLPSTILMAQMTLEVSIGVVGCKPPRLTVCFSRLYCLIRESDYIMKILTKVRTINEELSQTKPEAMLSGFALDTGDVVVLYLEGPRDGNILKIWELTEEFHPKVKPVFNTSARFPTRIYSEFLEAVTPFIILKTYVPLGILLACPSLYARPALPIPARIALLKFGRLIQNKYRRMPPRCEMPSAAELRSFRLELCSPPRTFPLGIDATSMSSGKAEDYVHPNVARINWERK